MAKDTRHHHARAICQQQWAAVLASYEAASLAYRPIRSVFEHTERRFFSMRKRGAASQAEITQREVEMDEATDDEHRFGVAFYSAARAMFCTPAPDLAGVICKVEMIRDLDWDENPAPILLADLNRLHARRVDDEQQ